MPRITYGAARRKSKKRILNAAKGYRGPRSKNWRLVQETVARATCMAQDDRRRKKRDFRGLWITRLSAACATRDIRYSRFIYGLKLAQVSINRKMLSELAVHDPAAFDAVVDVAKAKLN